MKKRKAFQKVWSLASMNSNGQSSRPGICTCVNYFFCFFVKTLILGTLAKLLSLFYVSVSMVIGFCEGTRERIFHTYIPRPCKCFRLLVLSDNCIHTYFFWNSFKKVSMPLIHWFQFKTTMCSNRFWSCILISRNICTIKLKSHNIYISLMHLNK